MQPRRKSKEQRTSKDFSNSGLSYGVANMDSKPLDRGSNKFVDFIMHIFLFLLGGIILCGMLYALVTFV